MSNEKCIKNEIPSKIIVRAQTAEEEFKYLLYLTEGIDFFVQNNYSIAIPDHPFFLKLFNNPELIKTLNKKEAKNIFIKEVYNPDFFKKELKTINKHIDFIEKTIARTEKWKKWGFKLFETHEVFLTAYGLAGGYNFKQGVIVNKISKDEEFNEPPCYNIIHEIIHIGIEEAIVKKFKLTHKEKEAVVEAICINYFNDIWVNDKDQDLGDMEILNKKPPYWWNLQFCFSSC